MAPPLSWLRWQMFTARSAGRAQAAHDQIVTDKILHALVDLELRAISRRDVRAAGA